jgi:hypothetical protein
MMCYLDGVAGENCMYHNGTAMYLATTERIYHLQTLQIIEVLGETAHKKLYLQRILTRYGGQNSLVSSDMKRVQDSQEPRFR